MVFLASCNNKPKEENVEGTEKEVTELPVGEAKMEAAALNYYEAILPAASSGERTIGLTLNVNGDAEMITDYNNYSPEIVEMGTWKKNDDGTTAVSLVTVGSGSSAKNEMSFKVDGDQLVYVGKEYGTEGLKLKKTEKPAPKDKELMMWVNKKKGTCAVNPPGKGTKECYQISYDKFAPKNDKDWQNFSEEIEGFKYVPGKVQQIKVVRKTRTDNMQDVSMYTYTFKEEVPAK